MIYFYILGHNEAKGSGSFSGDGVNVNNSSSDVSSKHFAG